jgi:hypothetical protein
MQPCRFLEKLSSATGGLTHWMPKISTIILPIVGIIVFMEIMLNVKIHKGKCETALVQVY